MTNLTKKEIQQRVLKRGKPLELDKFQWDEKTRTFSTLEHNLVLNFSGINKCTFNTGNKCTFTTGNKCTFTTGNKCTFNTGLGCTFTTLNKCTFTTLNKCTFNTGTKCTFTTLNNCTFNTGFKCTFNTGFNCIFKTGFNCTFNTGFNCIFDTDSNCTFKTGSDCTFNTGSDCTFSTCSDCTFKTGNKCTFNTGDYCTFTTLNNCTFNTGLGCTFSTGSDCTFKTGLGCTFSTGSGCTFKTGSFCVILNRNVFEIILPKKNDTIQICPSNSKGHLVNGIHSITGKKSIIADGILSEIISKKGNIYKVINAGKTEVSYLIEIDRNNKKVYSHGKTLEEAKESLVYKLADRDTSKYKNLTLDSILTKEAAIECYMTITGACGAGTKYFIDNLDSIKSEYSIKEIIDLTKSQFGNKEFQDFINN